MTTQSDYKHWDYHQVRYVPVTPKGGGEIKWEERLDLRDIYLPADVEDPADYLLESSKNEFREYIEYRHFTEVSR
jgi:hypothetical protein